jgi:hypothetical protein
MKKMAEWAPFVFAIIIMSKSLYSHSIEMAIFSGALLISAVIAQKDFTAKVTIETEKLILGDSEEDDHE